MRTQTEKANAFRALHERADAFIIPNPWDAGTARLLAGLGFEALATTSAGFAFSVGQRDNAVGLSGSGRGRPLCAGSQEQGGHRGGRPVGRPPGERRDGPSRRPSEPRGALGARSETDQCRKRPLPRGPRRFPSRRPRDAGARNLHFRRRSGRLPRNQQDVRSLTSTSSLKSVRLWNGPGVAKAPPRLMIAAHCSQEGYAGHTLAARFAEGEADTLGAGAAGSARFARHGRRPFETGECRFNREVFGKVRGRAAVGDNSRFAFVVE